MTRRIHRRVMVCVAVAVTLLPAGGALAASGVTRPMRSVASVVPSGELAGLHFYVVAPGDTFSSVATRFGVTPDSIRIANGITGKSLFAGARHPVGRTERSDVDTRHAASRGRDQRGHGCVHDPVRRFLRPNREAQPHDGREPPDHQRHEGVPAAAPGSDDPAHGGGRAGAGRLAVVATADRLHREAGRLVRSHREANRDARRDAAGAQPREGDPWCSSPASGCRSSVRVSHRPPRPAAPAASSVRVISCPVPGSTFTYDWGFPREGGRYHEGLDMFAPAGTPVLAPVDGIVTVGRSGHLRQVLEPRRCGRVVVLRRAPVQAGEDRQGPRR